MPKIWATRTRMGGEVLWIELHRTPSRLSSVQNRELAVIEETRATAAGVAVRQVVAISAVALGPFECSQALAGVTRRNRRWRRLKSMAADPVRRDGTGDGFATVPAAGLTGREEPSVITRAARGRVEVHGAANPRQADGTVVWHELAWWAGVP